MKKIHNYIMLFVMAFAVVSCADDEIIENKDFGKPGEEVQFGLSLEKSRTIYGPENTTANNFPIYWSEGDKVLVASPQCGNRGQAEYSVTPEPGQNFAKELTRTGEYGVQWGNTATADFYSIYPSKNASWLTVAESNVTAKLNIASDQEANLVLNGTTYSAADMDNVIMYARTAGVENGKTVNLQYNPYSTTLEFEVAVGPVGSNNTYGSAKVMSMTLEAPEGTNITGDFTLKFNGSNEPTIEAAGNNGDKITMEFTTQPVLNKDNSLKAKMSLIPLSGVTSLTDWKVSITVLEGNETTAKTYTKTLTPTEVNDKSDLVPGQIHKIKLPKLTPSAAWEYDTSNWITALYDYKNIYLTELSIPGAWYSLGKNENAYQASNHTATSLWNAGVRAFAVECRSYTPRKIISIGNNTDSPTRVVVSGLGSNQGGAYTHQSLQESSMVYISSVISNIANSISTSEFGVLVLSYADGGSGGHRDIDYAYFINGIKNEITQSGATNIYSEEITANTTISDVLGKLIIKINVDDKLTKSSYNNDMNALISYNPFLQQLTSVDYTIPLFSQMYWKTWDDTYKKYSTTSNSTDFLWCFSSANRTRVNSNTDTSIPSYAQRQTALKGMIQHSKNISENSSHNVWFYFNAGGTEATNSDADTDAADARTFATVMNPWLLEVIKLKANGGTDTNGVLGTAGTYVESDPSPLGIVMFNQCTGDNTTYHGDDIIKEIIEMNNKFKLQRYTPTPNPGDNTEEGGDSI